MVGSFGYKREYQPLSEAIGARLPEQIGRHDGEVVHPVEVLAPALAPSKEEDRTSIR
jgi:hypothetical protein